MSYKLEIEKVQNGYIVRGDEYEAVFQEQEIENADEQEQRVMKEVLWAVTEYFGVFNSKHNKTRLKIEVEEQNV